MNFRLSPLLRDRFDPLFSMSDDALARHGARRLTATKHPGFPCRVSLQDAQVGEEVLLVNFEHLPVDTPFRSNYAVYVRVGAQQAHPTVNEVPEMLRTRALSLRGWTPDGMLAGADMAEGTDLERVIAEMFSIPEVGFIHVHFAKQGCYAVRVDQV